MEKQPAASFHRRRAVITRRLLISSMLLIFSACAAPAEKPVMTTVPVRPEAAIPQQPVAPPPEAEGFAEPSLPPIAWTIQVGAFATAETAADYAAVLQSRGLDTYYFVDADGLFKVRVEHFDTQQAAMGRADRLMADGLIEAYFIVRPRTEAWPAHPMAALRENLLQTATRFIGTRYRWGSSSREQGFDCSGLTMTVYRLNGLELPRTAQAQYLQGKSVPRDRAGVGDLVFFDIHGNGRVSHVGICCGKERFIHAPGYGKQVQIASWTKGYFGMRFLGCRSYF